MKSIKAEIETCKTAKQVMAVLKRHSIKVVRDCTEEEGSFSIWISETERIYKPYRRPGSPDPFMKYQVWQKVKMEYSGAPMFSANQSYF